MSDDEGAKKKPEAKDYNQIATIAATIVEAVSEAGERGIPSGHMYAELLVIPGMTLDIYMRLIGTLEQANLITCSGHVLRIKKAKG